MNDFYDLSENSGPDRTIPNGMRWTPPTGSTLDLVPCVAAGSATAAAATAEQAQAEEAELPPSTRPAELRHVVGFDGSRDGGHGISLVTFTADASRVVAVFSDLATALGRLAPVFAKVANSAARFLTTYRTRAPRRTHRTFRRIVRTPKPPRHREPPAAPSALTADYTRRYRNRQGTR